MGETKGKGRAKADEKDLLIEKLRAEIEDLKDQLEAAASLLEDEKLEGDDARRRADVAEGKVEVWEEAFDTISKALTSRGGKA